jgi:hypothetical protein
MVQFPAPRWLYLVQGSLDQISVNHPEKNTHISQTSETRTSLCTTCMDSERFASSVYDICPSTVNIHSSLHISVIKWDWQITTNSRITNIKIQPQCQMPIWF